MAWKVERWLKEVFPGEGKIYSEYANLNARELVIVGVAVLDLALAELITKRMTDIPSEAEDFLGLDGDGRAPAASFGARIQLALLLGILSDADAQALRAMKELRNICAHHVKLDFLHNPALKAIRKIYDGWVMQAKQLHGDLEKLAEVADGFGRVPGAGEGMFFAAFATYQAYFHRCHAGVQRVGRAFKPRSTAEPVN